MLAIWLQEPFPEARRADPDVPLSPETTFVQW